eukprot:gene17828-19611_t
MFSNKFGAKNIFKALIGWSGLVYFFVAKNEAWGEAIGLTLFFASGQIQNALKPPFLESVWLSNIIDADNCLEAWRITLGLASSIYYFYFALYLNNGLSIYVSTVCLSLLWESQIVDDVINMLGTWLSCEMVPSMKFCAHNFEQLKVKFQKSKSRQRNIIQDFLCVLCKLYKHLKMNCEITSKFLITKIGSEKLSRDAESKILPDDAARKSKENAAAVAFTRFRHPTQQKTAVQVTARKSSTIRKSQTSAWKKKHPHYRLPHHNARASAMMLQALVNVSVSCAIMQAGTPASTASWSYKSTHYDEKTSLPSLPSHRKRNPPLSYKAAKKNNHPASSNTVKWFSRTPVLW